jgi:DNA-binding MarR family transcriptional regulator
MWVLVIYVDINLHHSMTKGKTVPFETTLLVRDSCLCLHVQRAARALARKFDEVLRPYGLTSGQFSLLMSLNRPAPPTMKDVAELLAMDRTTLTAALKPLARNGWVKVTPDKIDKRSKRLLLTAAGSAVLADAVPVWKKNHVALDAALPRSGDALRQDLMALL